MSLIETPTFSKPRLPQKEYTYLTSLHWDNEHSKRLQREIGDDKLCCAWSGRDKCWALARKIYCHVATEVGTAYAEVPFVWMYWVDKEGNALPITDERLIRTIRFGDTQTRGAKAVIGDIEEGEDKHHEGLVRNQQNIIEATAPEMMAAMKALANKTGFIAHRPTGDKAPKAISSASIWKGP